MTLRSEFRRWPALHGWVWEEQLYFQEGEERPYSEGTLLLSGETPTCRSREPWVLGMVDVIRCRENGCRLYPGVACAAHVHWTWEVRGGMNQAPAGAPHGRCSERFLAETALLDAVMVLMGEVVQPASSAVTQEDGSTKGTKITNGVVFPDAPQSAQGQMRLPGM